RPIVHTKYFADDVWIAALVMLPVIVAKHQDRISLRRFIALEKVAPEQRLHTEDIEKVVRDYAGLHALGGIVSQQQKRHAVILDDSRKRVVLAIVVQFLYRKGNIGNVDLLRVLMENDEILSMRIRQGPQQHAIDHAEDRGICANSQGEREDHERRKSGIAPNHAQAEFQVLN